MILFWKASAESRWPLNGLLAQSGWQICTTLFLFAEIHSSIHDLSGNEIMNEIPFD